MGKGQCLKSLTADCDVCSFAVWAQPGTGGLGDCQQVAARKKGQNTVQRQEIQSTKLANLGTVCVQELVGLMIKLPTRQQTQTPEFLTANVSYVSGG